MRRAGLVLGLAIVACCAFTQSAVGFVQVPGSPFPAGQGPFSLAFSPSGRLLAVANRGRYRGLAYSLSVFSVDQRTGALTQVPGSPFRAGSGPDSVVFSPDGGMLAVANVSGHSVSVFSVDQTTGALTQVKGSPFPTTGGPVAFSPDGGLLATPNTVGDSASVFSVDQRTGTLTPVPGSPFQLGIGSRPQSLAFSPVGGLLAIANNGEALSTGNVGPSVSVFSVDQRTGALTPVPGTPFPTGPGPYAVAFNRAGTLLAVSKLDNAVSVFSVDPMTGALSQVQGSPFPIAIGFGPQVLAYSPSGPLLAVANGGGTDRGFAYSLSVFSVDQRTGALTQLPGSPFHAGLGAEAVAFSPDGALLAVAIADGHSVSMFSTAMVPNNHFTITHVHTIADGTVTFAGHVPGPGSVDVLETTEGFVFSRAHTAARRASTIRLSIRPNARGRVLVRDHTHRVTLRLRVTYTPSHGRPRSIRIHGLHLPGVAQTTIESVARQTRRRP